MVAPMYILLSELIDEVTGEITGETPSNFTFLLVCNFSSGL
jgi:hypothetical protein